MIYNYKIFNKGLLPTVLHMIRRGFSGSFGSANILRQRKWEAQRANQPWAVAPPLRIYPLYHFFYKFREFNLSRM
tara:strand:- start:656 stop:880 length:225 start_codon:yes stop_codon:yes gene_type:complete